MTFDQPFGTFAPTPFQQQVIGFTRKQVDNWLGRRLSFVARRLVLASLDQPIDISSFDIKFRLHPFDNLCEKRILFTPQFFDPVERKFITEMISKGKSVIDIGANIGIYSLWAAKAGATVVAAEPQPEVFARQAFNIAANGFGTIRAVQCAVADHYGTFDMTIDSRNLGHSGGATEGNVRITVPCKTLLGLLDENGIRQPDLIKIDVEGAEDVILSAFFATAPANRHPLAIILETVSACWKIDCVALCRDNDYELVSETRMNVILRKLPVNGA